MLTKRIGRSCTPGAPSVSALSSRKSRLSCVQATSRSSPPFAARWKAPASRRHKVLCRPDRPAAASGGRAFASAAGSSGIVLLQSQISVFIGGYCREVGGRLWHRRRRGAIRGCLGLLRLVLEQAEELR